VSDSHRLTSVRQSPHDPSGDLSITQSLCSLLQCMALVIRDLGPTSKFATKWLRFVGEMGRTFAGLSK